MKPTAILPKVPGSILIARFGAFRVLVGGILLTALGSALRGAAPDAAMLFAATFVMGIGIAIMQPSLPPVVREWVPRKIALGTAVYSNGLLMGEALAASLTIPVVLPLAGGDWRLALVAWSVPIFLVALAGKTPGGQDHRSVDDLRGQIAKRRRLVSRQTDRPERLGGKGQQPLWLDIPVEGGNQAPVDGGRRRARKLLVDDRPDQSGEVRLLGRAQAGRTGLGDQPGDDGILCSQEAGSGGMGDVGSPGVERNHGASLPRARCDPGDSGVIGPEIPRLAPRGAMSLACRHRPTRK